MSESTFEAAVIRLNGEPAPTASLTLLESDGRIEVAVTLPASLAPAALKRLRSDYASVRVEVEIGPHRYSGTCSLIGAVGDYRSTRVGLRGQVAEQEGSPQEQVVDGADDALATDTHAAQRGGR